MTAFEGFLLVVSSMLFILAVGIKNKATLEREMFVQKCMEHNISLPIEYDAVIKKIKIKKYAESIEKE